MRDDGVPVVYTPLLRDFMRDDGLPVVLPVIKILLKGSTYYRSVWKNGFLLTSFPSGRSSEKQQSTGVLAVHTDVMTFG